MVAAVRISERLSAPDLFWWRVDEPQNPMVINILIASQGQWTPKALLEVLREPVRENIRLRAVPKNRAAGTSGLWGLLLGCLAALWYGSPWYWARVPDFDLNRQLRLHTLEEPTEEALHAFVDAEISGQLPKDQAQWYGVVIHNVPGGGSRILFRFHHVIADGAGLGQWFHSLATKDPGSPLVTLPECANTDRTPMAWVPPAPTFAADPVVKPKGPVGHVTALVEQVYALINFILVELILAFYSAVKLLFLQRDSNSPFKGPLNGRKRTCTTAGQVSLPVDEVKALGKAFDSTVTVNDMLCTLLAGAFRRFFRRHALHPEQMSMRVGVPMNMRTTAQPPIDMDNRFSLVVKSLPIHLPTIQERLASFHIRMGLMKIGIEPRLGMVLMHLLALAPDSVLMAVSDHFKLAMSAVLTNVMTSNVRLNFAGQTITQCAFWVPTSGDIGLGISLCTYCGDINIGLVVDENLLGDPREIVGDIVAEWAEMKKQLGTPGLHPPATIPSNPGAVLVTSSGLPTRTR